jgi:uncharacterized protein (TIGR00296 family)
MYSDADGEVAVRFARDALEAYVRNRDPNSPELPEAFRKKSGVFVTVNTYPEEALRGCVGYPTPLFTLLEAIPRASEGAATDPRFQPLRTEELDHIVVEVSILTPPKLLEAKRPSELKNMVRIGRDGLLAARGTRRGVLLPQVPVEYGWNPEEFLSQTCMKAGLVPDAWLDGQTRMYRFEVELFTEQEPRGAIVRRHLLGEHARH